MTQFSADDERFMDAALNLAAQAEALGEVPVGAIIVLNGEVIGEGFNAPISRHDSTAHAEINAIRAACIDRQNYRLPGASLYVTLEPCAMCAGAIVHSRIERVVCATLEPRAGAAGSVLNVLQNDALNHQCQVNIGLRREESSAMLKAFFKARR